MNEILKDLIVFGASWCVNCGATKQFLDAQGQEYTYVDVDSAAGKALAQEYSVRSLPWGQYQGRRVFTSADACRRWLASASEQEMPPLETQGGFDPEAYASRAEMLRAHDVWIQAQEAKSVLHNQHREAVEEFNDREADREGLPQQGDRLNEPANPARDILEGLRRAQPRQMFRAPAQENRAIIDELMPLGVDIFARAVRPAMAGGVA